MMEKTCLIIDDENQEDVFNARVKSVLKAKGFDVSLIYIDASSIDVRSENFHIDLSKFRDKINLEIRDKHIDVVACDYNLADEATVSKVMGTDIIDIIRTERQRVPIILYSGNYELVVKEIIENYKNNELNDQECVEKIKKLYKNHIYEFLGRTNYPEKINFLLDDNSDRIDSLVLRELRKYPDYSFQDAYPNFNGKKLAQIADEIDKNSISREKFLNEIVQQVISYMINVNSIEE